MFSGIIQRVGSLVSAEPKGPGLDLTLAAGWDDLVLGESVAVNGVCLTVATLKERGEATFFLSAETLACSSLGTATRGRLLNLERAVTLDTRLSGHLVQGHVDGVATLIDVAEEGEAHRLRIAVPIAMRRCCVPKGSIALDGVSLTINDIAEPDADDAVFEIAVTLIPHSWVNTAFRQRRSGDRINVEVDVIAKYVEQLCRPYPTPSIA